MNDFLTFNNIRLRSLEPEDIDLLYTWENNTAIWEVSNTRAPFSRHNLMQFIKDSGFDIYSTKQLRLIIEDVKNGKPVGAVDLFDFDPYHLRAGIGILIHKAGNRHKGYASDAIEAMCNYTRHILGMHQLYANIAPDNEISLKLFIKMGFVVAGTKKEWLKTPKGWKDELTLQRILV